MIFADDTSNQMEIFLSGIWLRGALSNCWTRILGGNIELSIVMSTVNTMLYFSELETAINSNVKVVEISKEFLSIVVTQSFWLETFSTMNNSIHKVNNYYEVWTAVCLIVPVLFGLGIQYMCPKARKFAVHISMLISLLYIISFSIFKGVFYFAAWMPYELSDVLKVGQGTQNKILLNHKNEINTNFNCRHFLHTFFCRCWDTRRGGYWRCYLSRKMKIALQLQSKRTFQIMVFSKDILLKFSLVPSFNSTLLGIHS